jgi:hypothetical protein
MDVKKFIKTIQERIDENSSIVGDDTKLTAVPSGVVSQTSAVFPDVKGAINIKQLVRQDLIAGGLRSDSPHRNSALKRSSRHSVHLSPSVNSLGGLLPNFSLKSIERNVSGRSNHLRKASMQPASKLSLAISS